MTCGFGIRIILFSCLLTGLHAAVLKAQATHDILPPMKPIRFAAAEIGEDGELSIISSKMGLLRVNDDGEVIDDENPPERRPRVVKEQVTQAFTVMVPVEVLVQQDGKNVSVTRMVPEERTRVVERSMIVGDATGYKLGRVAEAISHPLKNVEVFTAQRKPLTPDECRDCFSERTPIVLVSDAENIDADFHRFALSDRVLFVILKSPDEVR